MISVNEAYIINDVGWRNLEFYINTFKLIYNLQYALHHKLCVVIIKLQKQNCQ